MMRATEFEFRHRFWIISGVFAAGFTCYAFDPVDAGVAVTQWVCGHPTLQGSHDRHVLQAILGIGAGLTFLAALLRTWGAAYLRSEVVHDPSLHAEGLVADGPYRYVRNPLYLGGVLFAAGFGLAASRAGLVVMVGGLTIFYLRLIGREEAALLQTQDASYRAYLARVPRLLPSLTPRVPGGGMTPRWGQAWRGEMFMWIFACSAAVFAATLSPRAFYLVVALSFALAIVWRRSHAAQTNRD